jgi:hypothetical protein
LIFVDRIFTPIRPVWIGNLGTRAKIQKVMCCGLMLPFIFGIFVLAQSATSIKKKILSYFKKKPFILDGFLYSLQ